MNYCNTADQGARMALVGGVHIVMWGEGGQVW